MSKKLILIISLLLAFFFSFLFKDFIIESSLYVGNSVLFIKNKIYEQINEHFNQAEKIKNLVEKNKLLVNKINNLEAKINSCRDLKYFKYINKPNLTFVYTLSYASVPDFSKIYINYHKKLIKPKGLVYNNLVCGEVIKNIGNYSLAILNSNEKTRYTVYIGKNEIPGIFYGKTDTLKYIPKFKHINVGDEVVTSGLDGIFYKGAKVGIITEIIQKKLYQEAKVKLFYNDLHPEFFYVIEGGNNGN
ncbi:rod shape-determining protein MreC [Lebetimonas sp. JS032]|uniref:rod shape-determining protein MreC n=1 Tax=Lebetimonas sp. JS032 TaxID=990070 RepID=UPI0004677421|nr:rod shape-determining protein MreC [Lebetimonas sp. JS032]